MTERASLKARLVVKHWYRVDIAEGTKSRTLIGTSEYDPRELTDQLRSDQYLVLNDLSYRNNQNKIVSWSSWEPRLASVAYVNPKAVVLVMPFVGDPRGSESTEP